MAVFVAVLLAGRDGGTPTTTPGATSPPTSSPPSTSPQSGEVVVALPTVSALGAPWVEAFLIPYGEGDGTLGSAPGGDAGSLQLGPEYGAQAVDGTWWFLDAAKRRLAHFSETGEYLDAVPMKPEHLVDGVYFQFQLPHALDDGSLVATMLGEVTTALILEDADTSTVAIPAPFATRIDDGSHLYALSDTGGILSADPHTGEVEEVEWMLTRSGTRFRLTRTDDGITVELPDGLGSPVVDIRLVYADDPSIPVFVAIEAASGEDGTLFLYLYGGTDSGVGGQLGGFLSVSPDGSVSPVEPTREPFSPSDPGSPAHLGVRPGTNAPWLMFIDPEGVRVFTRGG